MIKTLITQDSDSFGKRSLYFKMQQYIITLDQILYSVLRVLK